MGCHDESGTVRLDADEIEVHPRGGYGSQTKLERSQRCAPVFAGRVCARGLSERSGVVAVGRRFVALRKTDDDRLWPDRPGTCPTGEKTRHAARLSQTF